MSPTPDTQNTFACFSESKIRSSLLVNLTFLDPKFNASFAIYFILDKNKYKLSAHIVNTQKQKICFFVMFTYQTQINNANAELIRNLKV